MGSAGSPARRDESRGRLKQLWIRLMQYQAAFSLPLELTFYQNCGDWLAARSVADLGTGTGYYLTNLAHYFPSKTYTGVDHDPLYIRLAQRAARSASARHHPRVHFVWRDLFEIRGDFDFVIARLLVQHLNPLDAFFEHARRLLRPNGTLLIIESDDRARRFVPELAALSKLFRTFRDSRREAGYDRDAILYGSERAKEFGLHLDTERRVIIPSALPGYKELFARSYRTATEIMRRNYGVSFDCEEVRGELRRWLRAPGSYAQIGVYMASYRRRG